MALALALVPSAEASAADWYAFHGGGALTGVASATLPDALRPRWTAKTGGAIKGSAAVANGLVYVGSGDGKLYAFDAKSGAVRFTFDAGGPIEATPLVFEGAVFIGGSDGKLHALDAATGKPRFAYATSDRILGGANAVRLPEGRALVVAGSYDHKLHAVDAKTGAAAWTVDTENYVHAVAAVADAGGFTRVVFGGCDGHLRAVDAATGERDADVKIGAYMAGSAAIDGPIAYLGHYGNEVIAVEIEEAKVLWRYKDRPFAYFSSPALTADTVVIGGRDRRLHALDRKTGKPRWVFQTQGKVDASPVVAGDKVVVGSADGRLYLLRLSDGKKLWSRDLGAAISASPAVADGAVYIGAEDGRFHALGAPAPATKSKETRR